MQKMVKFEYLQNYLGEQRENIISWYKAKLEILNENNIYLPIFSSFDLRDSGYKSSIVDSNVFPSGFNNLDLNSRKLASENFLDYLHSFTPKKNILIVPENHTRNPYYFNNINTLTQILKASGFKISLGYIEGENGENDSRTKFVLDNNGNSLKIEKIFRNDHKIFTESFNDGLIILNNDLSVKKPEILDNLGQPIMPPITLGWYNRKKSEHFFHFNKLIGELASLTSIEPWFLRTIFTHIDNIDFKDKNSLYNVAEAVNSIIHKITQKYEEYNISEEPFVFVKNNSGTYGLGIISVSSGKEIINLNSKNRKKMIYGKQRTKIKSVLIQEGIYTKNFVNNHPAEPVLYNVGGSVVGGFMRINPLKDKNKNLNTRGMVFKNLVENELTKPIIIKNGKFSLYSLLTMVADLAIAFEHKQKILGK